MITSQQAQNYHDALEWLAEPSQFPNGKREIRKSDFGMVFSEQLSTLDPEKTLVYSKAIAPEEFEYAQVAEYLKQLSSNLARAARRGSTRNEQPVALHGWSRAQWALALADLLDAERQVQDCTCFDDALALQQRCKDDRATARLFGSTSQRLSVAASEALAQKLIGFAYVWRLNEGFQP